MRYPISTALLLLILLPVQLSAAPATVPSGDSGTANLPITRVALYTSGVGYFERSGSVVGDASQTILFPLDQVNDVLKSLVLLDNGGGSILPITYGAQDPVSKQLEAFSVNIGDNPDQATLLARLRGAPVTISVQQMVGTPPAATVSTVTGTIVSVETKSVLLPDSQGTTEMSVLTLFSNGDLQAFPLQNVLDIQILDDHLKQELSQELVVIAQGRDVSKRPVTLKFSGQGKRGIVVGYLAETPLWQTSYRLVLGKSPILQGWANVQNTSQDDWNGIHLTLVSGRPVSFIQDLYSPIYIDRPIVAPRIASAPGPQTYASDLQDQEKAMPASPISAAGAPGAAYDMAGSAAGADMPTESVALDAKAFNVRGGVAGNSNNNYFASANGPTITNGTLARGVATRGEQLGTALFSYDIKVPVTVPRQQSAMIPFVQTPVEAEQVSIYNNSTLADHPMAGVRLKNTSGLHLMGGPLTVFDESEASSGYVGDALIDDTEPNQTRLLSYAVDLGIDAAVDNSTGDGEVVTIIISQGVLEITRRYEQSTVYTFKNHTSTARTVVVEHPNQGGDWKLLEPTKPTETTADLYRFDVPVKAGESHKFTVRESYPQEEDDALVDSDLGSLVVYSQRGEMSPRVKAALLEVITRRRAIAATEASVSHIQSQISALTNGQARIRENMKALQYTSELYKRYVAELDAQETELESLQTQLDSLNTQLAEQQSEMNDYVAHLNLS